MGKNKFRKIISLFLILILLIWQAPNTYAMFSPKISASVFLIKKDIREARMQNGVGSFLNAYEKVTEENKALKARGEPYSDPPSSFLTAKANIGEVIADNFFNAFYDDWSLLVNRWWGTNEWITDCLRDDIWELKALQEEIVNELLKAALLWDSLNIDVLLRDYKWLDGKIKDLKENYKDTELWFESGQSNYYVHCPYGEFNKAILDLKKSWDRFVDSFGFGKLQLGSLAEIADVAGQRARLRAARWIAENQIQFTLGGEQGASRRSLFSGPGLEGMVADLKTELQFAGDYGEMIFDENIEAAEKDLKEKRGQIGISDLLDAHRKAQEAKEISTKQMESALKFNLQLHNVDEQVLIDIESKLSKINWEIQRAFVSSSKDNKTIQDICEIWKKGVLERQCKDSGISVSCK